MIAIENVRLFKEIQERNAELREALEHQTATAEVLGIISRSPTDVQPVLDAIVESAARVCGIDDVVLRLREGNVMVARAHFGPIPIVAASRSVLMSHIFAGCASMARFMFPTSARRTISRRWVALPRLRTFLSFPFVSRGIHWILIARRTEVRPFTPAQIKLLETFADQAVIAIENVRLFQELRNRWSSRRRRVKSWASSPARRRIFSLCWTRLLKMPRDFVMLDDASILACEGDILRARRHLWDRCPDVSRDSQLTRSASQAWRPSDRRPANYTCPLTLPQRSKTNFQKRAGIRNARHRTVLAAPLLREGDAIGAILIRRTEVRPFTDKQITLLEDLCRPSGDRHRERAAVQGTQERNAELREALEHQTATAEVLGIISRSPTDVQPVLDAIVESAARVCEATDAQIRLVEARQERISLPSGSF